jgi:ElaB/YqjD/DUF883 family membrane-anchored ribosome-binding protein
MNSSSSAADSAEAPASPTSDSPAGGLENSRTRIWEAGEVLRQDLKSCGDQVRQAAGDLCSAAETTADQLRQQAETAFSEARKHAGTLCEQGEDYVRKNPLPSVLAALAAGFLVGVLIRR